MDSNQINNQMNNPDNNQVNNQMNNQVNNNLNNEQKNNDKKGKGSFYGILAVAIFIVMAVGATYAFFTATASSGSPDVSTGSAEISMDLISYGTAWKNTDLIPADTYVAEYAVEKQDDTTSNKICKDDKGRSVCSIYEFGIYSEDEQPITEINLITENNSFGNLYAMMYEVSKDNTITTVVEGETVAAYDNPSSAGNNDPTFKTISSDTEGTHINITKGDNQIFLSEEQNDYSPIYVNRKGAKKSLLKYDDNGTAKGSIEIPVSKDPEGKVTLANFDSTETTIKLEAGSIRHFIVVLYIKNINDDQTKNTDDGKIGDSGKSFSGKIEVKNGNGEGIQGIIAGAESANDLYATPPLTPTPEPTLEP